MNNELAGYFLYNEEYKEWEETHAGTPNSVPLYTHPAELTDEEIEKVIRKHWNKEYGNRNMLTLCKAVLKEAKK